MYYDGANWKWGDEMDESLVTKLIEDLDRVSKKIEEIQARLKVKKEQRKLWEIYKENSDYFSGARPDAYVRMQAKAAIDAVIECYKDWQVDFSYDKAVLTFPEYLKEKLL